MIVNKKQLAEVFGISERSFTEYQRDPSFPYKAAGRGHENEYDTAEVHNWLIHRATTKSQETAKERLDRLRGDSEELKIAQSIGDLVPAAEVERKLTDAAIAIRTGMLTGNSKIKNEIDIEYNIDLDIEILHRHARHLLTHLSTAAAKPADGDQPCPAEPAAAAADVEHGMGEHIPVAGT